MHVSTFQMTYLRFALGTSHLNGVAEHKPIKHLDQGETTGRDAEGGKN